MYWLEVAEWVVHETAHSDDESLDVPSRCPIKLYLQMSAKTNSQRPTTALHIRGIRTTLPHDPQPQL